MTEERLREIIQEELANLNAKKSRNFEDYVRTYVDEEYIDQVLNSGKQWMNSSFSSILDSFFKEPQSKWDGTSKKEKDSESTKLGDFLIIRKYLGASSIRFVSADEYIRIRDESSLFYTPFETIDDRSIETGKDILSKMKSNEWTSIDLRGK